MSEKQMYSNWYANRLYDMAAYTRYIKRIMTDTERIAFMDNADVYDGICAKTHPIVWFIRDEFNTDEQGLALYDWRKLLSDHGGDLFCMIDPGEAQNYALGLDRSWRNTTIWKKISVSCPCCKQTLSWKPKFLSEISPILSCRCGTVIIDASATCYFVAGPPVEDLSEKGYLADFDNPVWNGDD